MKSVDVCIALVVLAAAGLLAQEYLRPIPEPVSITQARGGRAPASLSLSVSGSQEIERAESHKPRLEGYAAALEELAACYETERCNFPRTDEKSYGFAVGQALRGELLSMKEWVEANGLRDESVSQVASAYLESEDGHVQEAAIALLATQPTSSASLEALLSNVIGGYDAQLIKQALRELERYKEYDDRQKIVGALSSALVTGSPFVAKEVSAGVEPFVEDSTLRAFEDAVAQLPEGSMVKANLARALAGFRERAH